MSKAEVLRALVAERLSAAAEEIFELFERILEEYEEERARSRERNQRLLDRHSPRIEAEVQIKRNQQLLDRHSPRTEAEVQIKRNQRNQGLLDRHSPRIEAEVQFKRNSPDLDPELTEAPRFKGEPEEQEQLPGPYPAVAVSVKIEEHPLLRGLTEETPEDISHLETEGYTQCSSDNDTFDEWRASSSSAAAQMETEADGDHYSQELNRVSVPESSVAINFRNTPEADSLQTQAVHADDKPYQCSLCDSTFKYFLTLKRHMKTHTTQCSSDNDDCDEWGASSSSAAAQMETGEDGDHYSQDLSRVFAPESSVAIDLRDSPEPDSLQTVQADDKPYQCSLCDGTFKYLSNLKRHMKTHTGDKPYACSVCGRSFMFMCEVKMHMRAHTGEKPYRCSLCDKQYKRSNHLSRHMRTHTGETPYSCVVCEHSFKHLHGLKTHMMKTHAQQNIHAQ